MAQDFCWVAQDICWMAQGICRLARCINEMPQRGGVAVQLYCRASPVTNCTPTEYNYVLTYFCQPL